MQNKPTPAQQYILSVLMSTIKAMLTKGLIAEESRYICSSGTWGDHETETWHINYKLISQRESEVSND